MHTLLSLTQVNNPFTTPVPPPIISSGPQEETALESTGRKQGTYVSRVNDLHFLRISRVFAISQMHPRAHVQVGQDSLWADKDFEISLDKDEFNQLFVDS